MLKPIFCILLTIGCVKAATISLDVNCTPTGPHLHQRTLGTIECSSGFQTATAGVSAQSFYQDTAGAGAVTSISPPHCMFGCISPAFATALFIDDYVFTITGGSGQGLFRPCLSAAGGASASFGNTSLTFGASCGTSAVQIPFTPFTFGVPQTFTLSLMAGDDGTLEQANLSGFEFFDVFGQPLTNVHFTLVSVPEPSTLWLCAIGSLGLLFGLRRNDR